MHREIQRSGLVTTALKQLIRVVPPGALTMTLVLAGVMSSLAADAGYVVLTLGPTPARAGGHTGGLKCATKCRRLPRVEETGFSTHDRPTIGNLDRGNGTTGRSIVTGPSLANPTGRAGCRLRRWGLWHGRVRHRLGWRRFHRRGM